MTMKKIITITIIITAITIESCTGISNRYEDVDKLKNNLFGLSALNGANWFQQFPWLHL